MKQHHDAHGRHKRIAIVQSIYEDGEVNVARYNPLASKQIAAAHVTGDIHIFDRNNIMNSKEEAKPIYNLKHHTKEGWGLNWNINHADQLVSGAIDSTVAFWKIPEAASDGSCKDVTPHTVYHHDAAVNDVKFSYKMDFLIGSASDDCTLRLWDTRKPGNKAACTIKESRGINSLDFNPHSEFLVATGSADETVKVWDMRKMDTPISQLYSHCDEVTKVQWCPTSPRFWHLEDTTEPFSCGILLVFTTISARMKMTRDLLSFCSITEATARGSPTLTGILLCPGSLLLLLRTMLFRCGEWLRVSVTTRLFLLMTLIWRTKEENFCIVS